jgi:hypothetical protein
MIRKLSILLVVALLFTPVAFADAGVYFISPQDADTVSGTFMVTE